MKEQFSLIYRPRSELLFPSLPTANPLADEIFNDAVAEEEGEYAGKHEDEPKDFLWHAFASPSPTSPDRLPSPPSTSP